MTDESDASTLPSLAVDSSMVLAQKKRKLKIRLGVVPVVSDGEEAKRPKVEESPLAMTVDSALKQQRMESVAEYLNHGQAVETPSTVEPTEITMSKIFKAASMTLSDCAKIVTSTKGYRTAKATHGVEEGCWYYEAHVCFLGESGHCRIGWATKQAHLHAPVGFDKYGYSYRDLEGTKQHESKREAYGAGYFQGDIIGCLIYCPKQQEPQEQGEQPPPQVATMSAENDSMKNESPKSEETVPGSFIGFSKNGIFQGIAFKDLTKGSYYPAVSLFTRPEQQQGASIELNFGPDFQFAFPHLAEIEVKGIHESIMKKHNS